MNAKRLEVDRQIELIEKLAAEIVPIEELAERIAASLREKRPLRVKYGVDPTTRSIHIGHLVPCRLLRLLQDLGHTAVLIIGDYTARVGDPTDRQSERKRLSPQEVDDNMRSYSEQLFRVVDRERAEVHYQSTWFDGMKLQEAFDLLSRFSVAQMLSHETFRRRLDSGGRLSLHELMYPAMQAYDSLQVEADIEIGGTDQRFNCLCGRDLQRAAGARPQVVITVPLLSGADGQKMSKSADNHISTDMEAPEVVGRVMSIPDGLMPQYIGLVTDWSPEERRLAIEGLSSGGLHPRDVKMRIARNLAAQLHGSGPANAAAAEFDRVFREKRRPERVERVIVPGSPLSVLELLLACGAVESRSEGRRLIEQGGVHVDGQLINTHEASLEPSTAAPLLLKVGKRRYFEVVAPDP